MTQKLIINGELTDLNTYINAERSNRYAAASIKKSNTEIVEMWARIKLKPINTAVYVDIYWYCENKRKDPDNIAFAKKFILDGLVNAGILKNDGFNNILGFYEEFMVDKENPRIEIILRDS